MDEPAKYLIHAEFTARGVVERSDVVGAVFGQTEGLLGDELDLRSLQASQRVGRIEVDVTSDAGVSHGTIRIDSDMDRVETAVLGAALETIERIGPCRATVEIERIEDVRAAKRRGVYDRAQELVASGFEDVGVGGQDIVEAVRAATTPVDIDAYAGFPAGPDVEERDEIIIVEGRADVARLLQFGITNVIGVEGTDVPDEIAALTMDRTATAFFDGDRGGDLLLVELAQIGDVDFVTFAPPGRSVEDLTHADVLDALAEKVPYEDAESGSRTSESASARPIDAYVEEVLGTGEAWTIDENREIIDRVDVEDLTEAMAAHEAVDAVVVDGSVGQHEADVAATNEVDLLVARDVGEFTKRPRDVRVLAADRLVEGEPLSSK